MGGLGDFGRRRADAHGRELIRFVNQNGQENCGFGGKFFSLPNSSVAEFPASAGCEFNENFSSGREKKRSGIPVLATGGLDDGGRSV